MASKPRKSKGEQTEAATTEPVAASQPPVPQSPSTSDRPKTPSRPLGMVVVTH